MNGAYHGVNSAGSEDSLVFYQRYATPINCTGVDHFLRGCDSLQRTDNNVPCQSIGMIEDKVRFDEFAPALSERLGSFAQLPEPL